MVHFIDEYIVWSSGDRILASFLLGILPSSPEAACDSSATIFQNHHCGRYALRFRTAKSSLLWQLGQLLATG